MNEDIRDILNTMTNKAATLNVDLANFNVDLANLRTLI